MSNRFQKDSIILILLKKLHISYLLTIALLIVFFACISTTGSVTSEKQLESLEKAIEKDVVQCYALEGTYPPSLDYLKEHYGLSYDETAFFVDYQTYGSNLRPDVTIIRIKEDFLYEE